MNKFDICHPHTTKKCFLILFSLDEATSFVSTSFGTPIFFYPQRKYFSLQRSKMAVRLRQKLKRKSIIFNVVYIFKNIGGIWFQYRKKELPENNHETSFKTSQIIFLVMKSCNYEKVIFFDVDYLLNTWNGYARTYLRTCLIKV